ncbi:MAG TPA: hypothetical protein PL045_09110, partial [Chitinophagaceae bacterium]|nr:hypothetical protein [Chitinophagaceae bacterium]
SSGTLSFKEYGRFLDMGTGRGNPLGGLKSTRIALQAQNKEGLAQIKKQRKRKIIYSRLAYGKLNWLIGKLLYGYTDETIAMIKQQLQQSASPVVIPA